MHPASVVSDNFSMPSPPDPDAFTCRNPDCRKPCRNRRRGLSLMCHRCWMRVPVALRRVLRETYREGQGTGSIRPSAAWINAADEAIRSVARRFQEYRPDPPMGPRDPLTPQQVAWWRNFKIPEVELDAMTRAQAAVWWKFIIRGAPKALGPALDALRREYTATRSARQEHGRFPGKELLDISETAAEERAAIEKRAREDGAIHVDTASQLYRKPHPRPARLKMPGAGRR